MRASATSTLAVSSRNFLICSTSKLTLTAVAANWIAESANALPMLSPAFLPSSPTFFVLLAVSSAAVPVSSTFSLAFAAASRISSKAFFASSDSVPTSPINLRTASVTLSSRLAMIFSSASLAAIVPRPRFGRLLLGLDHLPALARRDVHQTHQLRRLLGVAARDRHHAVLDVAPRAQDHAAKVTCLGRWTTLALHLASSAAGLALQV